MTATTVNIGIPYQADPYSNAAAFGVKGLDPGDTKAYFQIAVDEANRVGGIAGHKIHPIWYEIPATASSTDPATWQAMCSAFTQDNKVFAVLSGGTPNFQQCIQNAGAMQVYGDLSSSDAAVFNSFPYYYEPNAMNLDRSNSYLPGALARQGYFGGWDPVGSRADSASPVKIGVITFDLAAAVHAAEKVLAPRLSPYSKTVLVERVPADSAGTASAAVSNAVLKFKSQGVTHVLIVDFSGGLTLIFMQSAESQRYFPRYGLTSQNGAQALVATANIPADQLNGSSGIGWVPFLDLPADADPMNGPYSPAGRKRCTDLMSANGQTLPNANAQEYAFRACDEVLFLQTAAARVASLTRQAIATNANALRGGFESAFAETTSFGPSRHDGASGYRDMTFVNACSCFKYTGPFRLAS